MHALKMLSTSRPSPTCRATASSPSSSARFFAANTIRLWRSIVSTISFTVCSLRTGTKRSRSQRRKAGGPRRVK